MISSKRDISERIRLATAELRELEQQLKQGETPNSLLLQDFRSALDDSRMTAWTVSEMLHARERGKDAGKVLGFLTAERVRRITQMTNDLCNDIRKGHVPMKSGGLLFLADGLRGLLFRLDTLSDLARRPAG